MFPEQSETLPLTTQEDIIHVRLKVRDWMIESQFSLVEQTKMVTAASEIGRNTVIHGGGGWAELECFNHENQCGLRVTFCDQGQGILDIARAMQDGYSTGDGLGLGLNGSKRLVHHFEIVSEYGQGTRVTLIMFK